MAESHGMERFGRYLLVESIGSGGMAEVHRAIAMGAAGFTRQVAIKRMLAHLTRDETLVEMLISEAKLAASLSHPNIIPILDLGEQSGRYFIAMEFVPGQTLRAMLSRAIRMGRRLPLPFCFHAVQMALGALQYAHTRTDAIGQPRNIVHRDISPDNVMVSYQGGVTLMDFGIARAADLARLTQEGMLRGKPAYMSPESVEGAPVTAAFDLYATGVVLHELIAMRPMREPKRDLAMLNEAAKGRVPRFEDIGVDVPEIAAAVVYRALAYNPQERFADAAAFTAAIEEVQARLGWVWGPQNTAALLRELFAEDIEQEQRTHRYIQATVDEISNTTPRALPALLARLEGKRPSRLPLVAGGAALLLVAGTATAFMLREPPPPPPDPPPVVTTPVEPTIWKIPVTSLPDGASVAVDGEARGVTPIELPLRAGKAVTLSVEKSGHEKVTRQLALDEHPGPIHIELPALPVETPPPSTAVSRKPRTRTTPAEQPVSTSKEPAKLSLFSKPWGKVIVDGKDTGEFTPLTGFTIAPGRHSIEIVNEELNMSTRFSLDVQPGAELKETRSLRENAQK